MRDFPIGEHGPDRLAAQLHAMRDAGLRAAAATTELADTVRSLDDPSEPDSPELYPPYDGDGEPV